jgi:hypothetical protein
LPRRLPCLTLDACSRRQSEFDVECCPHSEVSLEAEMLNVPLFVRPSTLNRLHFSLQPFLPAIAPVLRNFTRRRIGDGGRL